MKTKEGITSTKVFFSFLAVSCVTGSLFPYFLSAMGKEPCIELGIAFVINTLGLFVTYAIKAYKGKKQAEITRLKEKRMEEN